MTGFLPEIWDNMVCSWQASWWRGTDMILRIV